MANFLLSVESACMYPGCVRRAGTSRLQTLGQQTDASHTKSIEQNWVPSQRITDEQKASNSQCDWNS